MSTEKFEIDEKEKHFFTVDWNMISKRAKIEQDGVNVANQPRPYSPLSQKFKFDIRSSERHHVEITVGPFHPIELKVDCIRAHPLL